MNGPLDRLGVVVLNWNGLEHLRACIASLLASDHPDFFVVVVDNASADGSADWLRATHPQVECLALPENRRFAGGNNAGAARAVELGAKVLLLLNNDTEIEDTALRRMGECLAEREEVGLVGPRIVYSRRPEMIWYGGGRFEPHWGRATHRALRRGILEGSDPEGPTGWITGCALMVRAEIWTRLGGLDESFYIYAEDVDFCRRAHATGAGLFYCPGAVVYHAVSASVGGQRSAFKAYHKVRARWQLMRRHGEGLLWPLGLVLRDVAEAGWLALRGAPRAAGAALRASVARGQGQALYPTSQLEAESLHGPETTRIMQETARADSTASTGDSHDLT